MIHNNINWGPGVPGGVPWDPRVGTHGPMGSHGGGTHCIPGWALGDPMALGDPLALGDPGP